MALIRSPEPDQPRGVEFLLKQRMTGTAMVDSFAYDLAPHVSKFCLKEWQDIWDACRGNKLYAIYPNIGGYQYKSSLSRRDAVLINRLRIGHTRLTHCYPLSGDDQPVSSACQSPLTVKHCLIECVNFAAIHRSILVLLQ